MATHAHLRLRDASNFETRSLFKLNPPTNSVDDARRQYEAKSDGKLTLVDLDLHDGEPETTPAPAVMARPVLPTPVEAPAAATPTGDGKKK